jgi:hypothetical protein
LSGNSDLRIILERTKGPILQIISRVVNTGRRSSVGGKCSPHLYDIPTSHGVSNATDGDESVELYLTMYTNSGLCLLSWSLCVDSTLQIVPKPKIFSLFVIQRWRCLTETVNVSYASTHCRSLSTTIGNISVRTEITGRTVVTVWLFTLWSSPAVNGPQPQ